MQVLIERSADPSKSLAIMGGHNRKEPISQGTVFSRKPITQGLLCGGLKGCQGWCNPLKGRAATREIVYRQRMGICRDLTNVKGKGDILEQTCSFSGICSSSEEKKKTKRKLQYMNRD